MPADLVPDDLWERVAPLLPPRAPRRHRYPGRLPADADGAAPEFAHGDILKAVTFWTVLLCDGTHVVRHLERHEPGMILHGVYDGTEQNLGKPIALDAFDATRDLPPVRALPIGKRLAVAYIPNTMFAPDWRDIPGASGLGTSDYQGAETFLSAIDETYTSWMRDIRLAKSRIIVPEPTQLS